MRFWLAIVLLLAATCAHAQTAKTPAQLLQEQKSCATLGQPAPCKSTTTLFGDVTQTFTPLTGSGAPATSAYFVGEYYRDTQNNVWYQAATAGNGAADWQQSAAPNFATAANVMYEPYNAKCDGSTNDYTAFSSAASSGLVLYVPGGRTCIIHGNGITLPLGIASDPGNPATIDFTSDGGSGTCGFIFRNTGQVQIPVVWITIEESTAFSMTPACVGKGTGSGNDTGMTSNVFMEHVVVRGTATAGCISLNDNNGHNSFIYVDARGCNSGLYIFYNNGDTVIRQSNLIGNQLAGIECAIGGGCLGGGFLITDNTLLGFQPYGIYEPTGTGASNFMQDGDLDARFEQVGCAAIWQASTESSGHPGTYAVRIKRPGFSFNSANENGKCGSETYAIQLVNCNGIDIEQGDYPFTSPGSGDAIINCEDGARGIDFHYEDPNQGPPNDNTQLVAGSTTVQNLTRVDTPWYSPCAQFTATATDTSATATIDTLSDYAANLANVAIIIKPLNQDPWAAGYRIASASVSGNNVSVTFGFDVAGGAPETTNLLACLTRTNGSW
jgi:hypothetical protein